MKNLVSMEECKNSRRLRTNLYVTDSEWIPRGDAIVRDHQVEAGTSLSALVGFVGGKFRVVEKPTVPEAYTVLLFSFSSSGLTTTCIKLIATSKLTEERLKSYPSIVKIASDGILPIDGPNAAMVKKLVLFEQMLPLDVKQYYPNVVTPQGEGCHIKCIAVDQTANCNVVVFVTETMSIPCYLADENNQCDCEYILAQLSSRLLKEPSRELSQKLQFDCTAPLVSMRQREALHVCMFCGGALVRAKQCGRICNKGFTKQNFGSRPVSRTVPNLKSIGKNKKKKTVGCCTKKRKGDQSDAYILKRADDYSFVDDEPQIRRENGSRPCYKDYNRSRPQCKPSPEFKLSPECKCCSGFTKNPMYKQFSEYKLIRTGSKTCCRKYAKRNNENILREECSAAKRGSIASSEYCTSDTQTELPLENTDFYLICQAYQPKSDKQAYNKYNRRRLEEKTETSYEHSKKHSLLSQRDQLDSPRTEAWPSHLTRFNASVKSSDSTRSITKQLSTDEEVKEISIESTESYFEPQMHNAPNDKNKNLLIGRVEGDNFQTYPFRNNFMHRSYGTAEGHNTCRKIPSVSSRSRNGSYLRITGRPKRLLFPKKIFKSFHLPRQRSCNSKPSTCYIGSNDSSNFRAVRLESVLYSCNKRSEW